VIATLVAWFGGVLAVYAAWRAMRDTAVEDGASGALRALGRRRDPSSVRFDESRAGQLCREVLTPATSAAALGELRITLSEVARDSAKARNVPRAAARAALALGTAVALIEFARGLGTVGGIPVSAVSSFVGGFVGSVLAGWLGRRARARASHRERAWTELGAALARHLSPPEATGPGPHGVPQASSE
jgi:hypothetical protein